MLHQLDRGRLRHPSVAPSPVATPPVKLYLDYLDLHPNLVNWELVQKLKSGAHYRIGDIVGKLYIYKNYSVVVAKKGYKDATYNVLHEMPPIQTLSLDEMDRHYRDKINAAARSQKPLYVTVDSQFLLNPQTNTMAFVTFQSKQKRSARISYSSDRMKTTYILATRYEDDTVTIAQYENDIGTHPVYESTYKVVAWVPPQDGDARKYEFEMMRPHMYGHPSGTSPPEMRVG